MPKPPVSSIPKINIPEPPALNLPPLQGTGHSAIVHPNLQAGMSSDTTPPAPLLPISGPSLTQPSLLPLPALNIQDTPTAGAPTAASGSDPLHLFRLSTSSSNLLPAPGVDGVRVQAQRRYVDIQSGGTILVEFDAAVGMYRAKRRNELTASGPTLRFNPDSRTWRLASSKAATDAESLPGESSMSWMAPEKQQDEFAELMEPHSYGQLKAMFDTVQLDQRHSQATPPKKRPLIDEQPGPSKKRPLFEELSRPDLPATPLRLPVTQPTTETGNTPDYVEMARITAEERGKLLEQLQVRMNLRGPHKTLDEVVATMKPYNLSNRQLTQMLAEMQANGTTPQWAENHKQTSIDETNVNRFDDAYEELLPEIFSLRNRGRGFTDFNAHYTRAYLDGLLAYAGYKRNKYNCLYRTDIPAMFRGDDRTPFEFSRDGHMLPRRDLGEGSTTQKAVSATFSLNDAKQYIRQFGKQSGIEELLYDTQYHKYPGDLSRTQSSDTESVDSAADSDADSGSDSEPGRITEKDYYPKRLNQNIAFCYLLDTRNIEIVPARENYHFNRDALDESKRTGGKTWFPDDDLEGHISVSSRGFSADRIWLVNSTFTRAARVSDIYLQSYVHADHSTRGEADSIEERTWAGANNLSDYDMLIDQVAAANKPVINFPAGKEVFSNDVVFTPDLITPTTA